MAANSIIFDGVIDNTNVTSTGANDVYISPELALQNVNSLEVVVQYSDNLPDPEVSLARYNLVAILEEKMSEGNWRPFQSQTNTYVKAEQGSTFIFTYGKGIFSLDPSLALDASDGTKIISRQYKEQGYLSDEFRVRIVANCHVAPTEIGCFVSSNLKISYKTYNF